MGNLRVGTAGWTVPRGQAKIFGLTGSHLQRYATALNCVEVNSSFYRPHALKTWERWAAAVPEGFKFAVKAPKAVTHEAKLFDCGGALVDFFGQVLGLRDKLGPVLFQLPPKGVFMESAVREFLTTLRELYGGLVALEPRHVSWFGSEANRLLREYGVARVAADPPQGSPLAARPDGDVGWRYFRWHGSPRIYWSAYEDERLKGLAAEIENYGRGESWVIFDNTAAGFAMENALSLAALRKS